MMLPKEKILANRLSIAMHDWPAESRANMIEWVTDALKEQRDHEREECAKYAQAWADLSSSEYGVVAGREIAKAIRARPNT
jgi:hypothetical protein